VPRIIRAVLAAANRAWRRRFDWLPGGRQRRPPAAPTSHPSEERFHALFEHAEDLIVSCRLDGTITDVNRAAEKAVGWSRAELIGQNVDRIVTAGAIAPSSTTRTTPSSPSRSTAR